MKTIVPLLFFCSLIGACATTMPVPAASPVTEKLIGISGKKARICGAYAVGTDDTEARKCAFAADAKGKPFWLALELRGTDSAVWQAIGRDASGRRYALFFDSAPRSEPVSDRNFSMRFCSGVFTMSKYASHLFACAEPVP